MHSNRASWLPWPEARIPLVSFALFEQVPSLASRIARVELGAFPTPVEALPSVSRALGVDGELWVKRDDVSSPVYGGNKVRTLELLFGRALADGRTAITATGAFGSNHALATALHAPRVGLSPGALLFPQPASLAAYTNLRALAHTQAVLHAVAHWSLLPFAMAWHHRSAPNAFLMAPGGATPLGALGYVSAGIELGRQIENRELPLPARIIVGVGSTCTSAGLLVGLCLAAHFGLGFRPQTRPRLISVRVTPWPVTSRFRILSLATRAARLLYELSDRALPLFERSTLGERLEIDGSQLGRGYGEPSLGGEEGGALWRRLGLPALDGTYSAKAAARAVSALRAREVGPSLFWSTKSSVPLPTGESSEATPERLRAWLARAAP